MNQRTSEKASHASPKQPKRRKKEDCYCLEEGSCGCWVDDYNQACDDWEVWVEHLKRVGEV